MEQAARTCEAAAPVRNKRILIIDDIEAIHADYKKILCPDARQDNSLASLKQSVFGGGEDVVLGGDVFEVDSAKQGQEGASLVQQACDNNRPYAVAFVDMRMPPGWDGIQTIEKIWDIDPDLHVVICSAHSDYSHGNIHDRFGNNDRLLILRKPFDTIEVLQLAVALTTKWELLQASRVQLTNLERMVEARTLDLHRANEELHQVNDSLRETLCEVRDVQNQLRYDAQHDALTGLANRVLLSNRLDECIARRKRNACYSYATLFLDLDNFKIVNDSLGHAQGDRLLECVAQRLRGAVRLLDTASRPESETIGRPGGDEFVIILDGIQHPEDAVRVAERILEALEKPIDLDGEQYSVACSVGITTSEHEYDQADEILRDSDTALYEAKRLGKNQVVKFDRTMRKRVLARLRVNNDLRQAIERDELKLQYQPIIDLESGKIVAFEALLRWMPPEFGPVPPEEFIPIAEECGVITGIGEWVLRKACEQLAKWQSVTPDLRISVNVSPRQLVDQAFADRFQEIVSGCGIRAKDVSLEVTETAMIKNNNAIAQTIASIRELGTKFYMDDFGTGYSSLSYLDTLRFDMLKIDRSFVKDINQNRASCASLNTIVQLCEVRGLGVIAEGVESHEALSQLQALGCGYAQGYFFSRPVDADAAAALLNREIRWVEQICKR